jgi:hypothetical protein
MSLIRVDEIQGFTDVDIVTGPEMQLDDLVVAGTVQFSSHTSGYLFADGTGTIAASGTLGESVIPSGIDAAKVGTGVVNNTEFGYLNGVNSAIQTQLNTALAKQSGDSVQIATYSRSDHVTTAVAIPFDDTIPQITEGAEVLSVAITPTSATNKLHITVNLSVYADALQVISALFKTGTSNALSARTKYYPHAEVMALLNFEHVMDAGTVSEITFKVRIGEPGGASIYLNGNAGGRLFGGVCYSCITVVEYKA